MRRRSSGRLACLRGFYRWLRDEKIADADPFKEVEVRMQRKRRLPRSLAQADLRRLLNALQVECDRMLDDETAWRHAGGRSRPTP